MLPYFDADVSLGIVQSPQYFRTRGRLSWMERGAGAVQELFYQLNKSHGTDTTVLSALAPAQFTAAKR